MAACATPMHPVSVLIVDDVEAFARLLADGLREQGHTAVCAHNGRDAKAIVDHQRFDVVVTDIIMPESDGFELIDHVKHVQPGTRIVAMSGGGKLYSAGACLQAAEQAGVDAILQKPFNAQRLVQTLDQILGSRTT